MSFITTTHFCRLPLMTVSNDRIDFKHAIPTNSIIELIERMIKIGNTNLKIKIKVFVKKLYQKKREQTISNNFSFITIDDQQKPVPILPNFAQ